jgi:hypothetical protein
MTVSTCRRPRSISSAETRRCTARPGWSRGRRASRRRHSAWGARRPAARRDGPRFRAVAAQSARPIDADRPETRGRSSARGCRPRSRAPCRGRTDDS